MFQNTMTFDSNLHAMACIIIRNCFIPQRVFANKEVILPRIAGLLCPVDFSISRINNLMSIAIT